MQRGSGNLHKRMYYLMLSTLLILGIILWRLFHLQVTLMQQLFWQGKKNCTRIEKTTSLRGTILDCNGIPLATNRPTINLHWHSTGKTSLDTLALDSLKKLEKIVGSTIIDNPETMALLKNTERYCKDCLLVEDLSLQQVCQIEEQLAGSQNVRLVTKFKRFYPHKNCASHILGYLGNLDFGTCGKMGLEKLLDENLRGEPGTLHRTINSCGKSLAEEEMKKALAGQDIQTTIDITLQEIIEKVFPDEHTGSFIVMDPETGSIKALLSRPNFDPNMFLQPIIQQDWQTLCEKQSFINRTLNASYPLGSIFKLVTISAALEKKITTPDAIWNCCGYLTFGKRQYHCHELTGHGQITTGQAVALSCNSVFYKLGKQMDIDLIADYAHRFGLGERTNIMFPENSGLIPTRAWKRAVKKEPWRPGETLSAAIGQSFILATPMQVAKMISSIFTGYLATPRILTTEPIETIPLNIQPDTLSFLRGCMKKVVTCGTGQRVSHIKDMVVHAKTSTAQTSALEKATMGKGFLEHAWFVGSFRYKQNKPLTFVILAENVGSSRTATAIAQKFLMEYKRLIDATN
jgi:penicillin-binding protein 2